MKNSFIKTTLFNATLLKPTLLFVLAASLLLSGCSSPSSKPVEPSQDADKPALDIIKLSPEAVRRSGIELITVQTSAVASQIVTTGEIQADENRLFHINSLVAGRIVRDNVMLGQFVHSGQALAVVQNLEVAKIQADYIHQLHQNEIDTAKAQFQLVLAQRNFNRERRLLAEGISPRKDYYQAETDADIARIELSGQHEHKIHIQAEGRALLGAYGMQPVAVHSEIIRTGTPVTTPRTGIVIKKIVTLGDVITPDTTLYEVADLSRVWLDVTIYPTDFASIRQGQRMIFQPDTLPNKTVTGRIDYLPPQASEASRTYVARAFLDNRQGLLKPGMFGQVCIEQGQAKAKPYLPEAAIQRYGKETFVFRVLENGRYQKQPIVLGAPVKRGYLLQQGLEAGDRIVGKGSFALKAELLKSQFAEEE